MLKIYIRNALIICAVSISSFISGAEGELKSKKQEELVAKYSPDHNCGQACFKECCIGGLSREEPDCGYTNLTINAKPFERGSIIEITASQHPDRIRNLQILGHYEGGQSCCFPLCCFACCLGGCPDLPNTNRTINTPIPLSVIKGVFHKTHLKKSERPDIFEVSYQSENRHNGYRYTINFHKSWNMYLRPAIPGDGYPWTTIKITRAKYLESSVVK